MNNKAFTTVELIVSFALTVSIAFVLFQVVINLKDMYVNNGIKTELLNKQAIISNKINDAFITKKIKTVTTCGSDCLQFTYLDETFDKLILDKNNRTIEFGSYKTELPSNSKFGSILVDTFVTPVFDKTKNDSFLIINISINNDSITGNYGINVLYQYNSLNTIIPDISI